MTGLRAANLGVVLEVGILDNQKISRGLPKAVDGRSLCPCSRHA